MLSPSVLVGLDWEASGSEDFNVRRDGEEAMRKKEGVAFELIEFEGGAKGMFFELQSQKCLGISQGRSLRACL